MNRRSFLLILPLAGTARAANDEKPQLRLGVIADPQYADKDVAGSRHYRASLDKLRACIAELNRQPLDAVVTLGDFIDEDLSSYAPVLEIYEGLKHPHLKVLGNHDFSVGDDEQKRKVLPTLGLKSGFSSEVIGKHRIITLDGTDVSRYRPGRVGSVRKMLAKLEREKRSNNKPSSGGIGEDQLTWLEKELEAATARQQTVLLCCHYPVLPKGKLNLWNDLELMALIDRFPCVAAWFNGHNHRGNYASRKHCHYVNFKGMVETADRSAYAITRCYPDRIEVEGFDTEPNRSLALA